MTREEMINALRLCALNESRSLKMQTAAAIAAELRRLGEIVERQAEALAWYADQANYEPGAMYHIDEHGASRYPPSVMRDHGKRAADAARKESGHAG